MKENSKNFKLTKIEMIPKEWEIVGLGNIVEVYDSKRIPLSKMERREIKGIYPYCGANGIIDYINDYIFDGEFVLLAEDGGSYNKFGKTAYLMSGKFWVNNHAHILNARKGTTTNLFLLNVLNFFDLNPYIVGSTRTKMNQEQMRRIKLPLPPLPEQQKIAEILSTVDKAIEKVDEAIKKTQKLKKGIMQELLNKGIGHKEFNDSEIGRIPKEWGVYKLGDISIEVHRYPTYYNINYVTEGVREIRGQLIKKSGALETDLAKYRCISQETSRRFPRTIVKKGDFVMSVRGTMGKIAIIPDIFEGSNITANLMRISLNQIKCYSNFYKYVFLSAKFQEELNLLSSQTTIKTIQAPKLKSIKLPLPPITEQQKIAEILSTVDSRLEILRKRKGKLERIKKGLMNDLLTGRKRVKLDA